MFMPTLATGLARLDGRLESTHNNFALHLRSAGLIAQSGRGNGAGHVGAEDAATMLIAGMATDSPTAAPRTVAIFQKLRRLPAPADKSLSRTLGLLIQLPTFHEFVTEAINLAHVLKRELQVDEEESSKLGIPSAAYGLDLHVSRSVPAAMLALRDPMGRRRSIAEWVDARKASEVGGLPEVSEAFDRRLTATATQRTLYAIGDLLAHEPVEVG